MYLPSTQELEDKLKPKFKKRGFDVEVTENIYFRLYGMDFMIPK